jgi:hypothetical protein
LAAELRHQRRPLLIGKGVGAHWVDRGG